MRRGGRLLLFPLLAWVLSTPALAQPLTVIDALGQTITLAQPASRIVSLAPSITETLFALGLDEEIVGVTAFCDYPPKAKGKPKVGMMVNPNIERLVAMRPDLVIAVKDLRTSELVGELDRLHLPLYIADTMSVARILEGIAVLGRLSGHVAQAEALVSVMRRRMQTVEVRVHGPPRPTVLYILWPDPLMTVGPGSFISELIAMAGGENLAPAHGGAYPRLSMETVLAKNPDVLIFASEMGEATVRAERQRWRRWNQIAAVQHQRLYAIDSNLLHRPGPRIVDGLESLAALFHPERIGSERPHALRSK